MEEQKLSVLEWRKQLFFGGAAEQGPIVDTDHNRRRTPCDDRH